MKPINPNLWACGVHKPDDVGVVCGACHDAQLAGALTDIVLLKADRGELVEALRNLANEYTPTDSKPLPDHACAECVPGGEIVRPGWLCATHRARALLARVDAPTTPAKEPERRRLYSLETLLAHALVIEAGVGVTGRPDLVSALRLLGKCVHCDLSAEILDAHIEDDERLWLAEVGGASPEATGERDG